MGQIDDMCFENLDEYINDENKRVTYKWLSQTLDIHVNQAKQALYSFVDRQRNQKDNDSLSVTYVLTGLVKQDGVTSNRVQLIPEELLDSGKSAYSVLTSCHVYSVQKGKLKDPNVLYSTDYDTLKENILNCNQHSAITYSKAKLRSEAEIEAVSQVKPSTAKVEQNCTTNGKHVNASHSTKATTKSSKPTGIAAMFKPGAPKVPGKDTEDKTEGQDAKSTPAMAKESNSKSKAKPSGGVMSFFAKQAAKPKSKAETSTPKEEPKQEPKSAETKSPEKKVSEEPSTKELSPQKDKKISTSAESKRGKKQKAETDEEDPLLQNKKKRRRIKEKVVESSSSEEEEMEIESPIPSPEPPEPEPEPERVSEPEPEPPSPTPAPVPEETSKPSPVKSNTPHNENSGKVKKRKLVSKTFVNEEGFMVTEKVWQDEWEDAPEPAKQPARAATTQSKESKTATKTKKNTSPGKKSSPDKSSKQTSLMSFFKKK